MSNSITFRGNLGADPEVKVTESGKVKARLFVIENRRLRGQDGQWRDGTPNRHNVEAWGQLAENLADSIRKGDPVTVTGTLVTSEWQDRQTGETRSSTHINADDVAFSMRNHVINEATKSKSQNQGQQTEQTQHANTSQQANMGQQHQFAQGSPGPQQQPIQAGPPQAATYGPPQTTPQPVVSYQPPQAQAQAHGFGR